MLPLKYWSGERLFKIWHILYLCNDLASLHFLQSEEPHCGGFIP